MKLIITADDFGASSSSNAGIARAFERNLISRASMMATGQAFQEGVDLAKSQKFAGKLGVHLVLTEGNPLTQPIKSIERFCDGDGKFCYRKSSVSSLSSEEEKAVRSEWDAQIKAMEQAGIPPTHVDSHHHVHTDPGLLSIATDLASARKLPVRLSLFDPSLSAKAMYKRWVNYKIRSAGLAGTDCFTSRAVLKSMSRKDRSNRTIELMVHPVLSGETIIDAMEVVSLEDLITEVA